MTKLQCGYEDECPVNDCLKCKRYLQLKPNVHSITLAEATCVEEFGVVDLECWQNEKPKQLKLAQDVMRKLQSRIKW